MVRTALRAGAAMLDVVCESLVVNCLCGVISGSEE